MATVTFDDFDQYVAEVQNANVTMLLNRLVRPEWTIQHFEASGLQLQMGEQGSGDLTTGLAHEDAYTLYVPLSRAAAQKANGTALSSRSVLILPPGSEFCLSSSIDHAWCSVSIPTEELGEAPTPSSTNGRRSRVVEVSAAAAKHYRVLVNRLLSAVEETESLAESEALRDPLSRLRRMSIDILGAPINGEAAPTGRPRIPRGEILRRVAACLDKHEDQALSVGDLAVECDISERTLRTAFKDYFGLPPKDFLQLRRLHQVRRALRASAPQSTSVSEVLVRYGEWEFGRFAARYRQTFGELPSETLNEE